MYHQTVALVRNRCRETPSNGTSRQAKKVMDAGTKPDELKRAVLDLKAEAGRPPQAPIPSPHLPDSSQTVQQYCVSWLKLKTPEITPSTLETYAAAINNYIVPRLGWMACKDLSRDALKSWIIWAKSLWRKGGKQYTQDTMRQWWRVLKVILGDMVESLNLPRDPRLGLKPPSRPELDPVREQNTLDAVALGRLLTACRETAPQWYAEVATMALTGARAGEVYGLKWDTPLRPDTSPRQRFDVFCDGWLATRELRVSPSTAETYKAAIKAFIKPRLGWMECQDITRQAIESWVI